MIISSFVGSPYSNKALVSTDTKAVRVDLGDSANMGQVGITLFIIQEDILNDFLHVNWDVFVWKPFDMPGSRGK
jgi:hypothetical protein